MIYIHPPSESDPVGTIFGWLTIIFGIGAIIAGYYAFIKKK